MKNYFDVLIIGLGAHGSSAAYHLSKAGLKVCGIDRFHPPHSFGSSHGQSRIIRQAYHESPMYVPLVKTAYTLWRELEEASGKKLFLKTGGIMLGSENASVVQGAKLSAEMHNLPYEYLHYDEIIKRFPVLKPTEDTVAVIEKDAGILFPEECIKANLELAAANKAVLTYDEVVETIYYTNDVVTVTTNKSTYYAHKLVISAGAWLNNLLPELHLPLTVERQVLCWFKNADEKTQQDLLPGKLPIFIWEHEKDKLFYGFPDIGDGLKIAPHHAGQPIQPDLLSQQVNPAEIDEMKTVIHTFFNMQPVFNYSAVCMYTNTPDEHFIIDHHPGNKNIVIASPCSGHGFKFSSVIGKILSDMILNKEPQFDLKPFSITRFQ